MGKCLCLGLGAIMFVTLAFGLVYILKHGDVREENHIAFTRVSEDIREVRGRGFARTRSTDDGAQLRIIRQ